MRLRTHQRGSRPAKASAAAKARPEASTREQAARSPSPSPVRASSSWSVDDVVGLQHTAGNGAVAGVLQRQQTPGAAPAPVTPQSIDAALKSIRPVSSKTTQVNSLRPWEIFKTLPWNPSDGGKKRLYSALRHDHATLRKAQAVLAEAQRREGAARASPSAPVPAPGRASRSRKMRKGKPAKALPAVAEAQSAVDAAEAAVRAKTIELKAYVKGKLDSRRDPLIAPQRTEKSDAAAALKQASAALRAASRKKRPDPAVVADLTAKRDAAQARVSKASEALSARLAELQTDIDAADWGEQSVGQTVAAYEVDGARATLTDHVDAYATVDASGLEGSATKIGGAGPSVRDLLANDATLSPSTREILAIISKFEGGFSAVNTWDVADVTFGMVQWTTGAGGHGDLIRALTIMKQAAPAAFADRLVKYGIDVAHTGLVLTRSDGTVLTGAPAAKAVQADPKLTAVLSAAGTDPALQAAELRAANEIEVRGALSARLPVQFPPAAEGGKPMIVQVPVSSLMTSEFGIGVLANHTVHGGFPGDDLTRAANAFVKRHKVAAADIATWAASCEADLIAAISKGNDADRVAAMKKKLSAVPGSFN